MATWLFVLSLSLSPARSRSPLPPSPFPPAHPAAHRLHGAAAVDDRRLGSSLLHDDDAVGRAGLEVANRLEGEAGADNVGDQGQHHQRNAVVQAEGIGKLRGRRGRGLSSGSGATSLGKPCLARPGGAPWPHLVVVKAGPRGDGNNHAEDENCGCIMGREGEKQRDAPGNGQGRGVGGDSGLARCATHRRGRPQGQCRARG